MSCGNVETDFVVDVDKARRKSGESARLKFGSGLPRNGLSVQPLSFFLATTPRFLTTRSSLLHLLITLRDELDVSIFVYSALLLCNIYRILSIRISSKVGYTPRKTANIKSHFPTLPRPRRLDAIAISCVTFRVNTFTL